MTMTFRRTSVFLVATLALSARTATPHHAFTPVYDATRSVTVQGIVTEFKLMNPHALMTIDVKDASGQVVTWTVEFDGLLNLSEFGWTARTIAAGEALTVSGNPTHTGSPRLFFRRLVRAGGEELVRGIDAQNNAIDEERRKRAQQRSQQK
jgi:uncharacterized protein DUF6152